MIIHSSEYKVVDCWFSLSTDTCWKLVVDYYSYIPHSYGRIVLMWWQFPTLETEEHERLNCASLPYRTYCKYCTKPRHSDQKMQLSVPYMSMNIEYQVPVRKNSIDIILVILFPTLPYRTHPHPHQQRTTTMVIIASIEYVVHVIQLMIMIIEGLFEVFSIYYCVRKYVILITTSQYVYDLIFFYCISTIVYK